MTLILSGTNGLSDVNGSAAAPAITGTDTDTGVFFGTNTVSLSTGGTERARVDSSGNLGLGVTSPTAKLTLSGNQSFVEKTNAYLGVDVATSSGNGGSFTLKAGGGSGAGNTAGNLYLGAGRGGSSASSGAIYFGISQSTNAVGLDSTLMTLDASGNLLIGATSGSYPLLVKKAASSSDNSTVSIVSGTAGYAQVLLGDTASDAVGYLAYNNSTNALEIATNGSERARIDSSGNLLVGGTSAVIGSQTGMIQAGGWILPRGTNVPTGGVGGSTIYAKERVYFGDNTGWTWDWYTVNTSGTTFRRFYYTDAGASYNATGTWGAISDVKLKENITDATPKLEKLNQVRVVNYNRIGEEKKELGVIAQELEQIFPNMVEETPDRDEEGNELGTTTKAVKYSVFVPMLIKAIQEQQAIITQLQADVAALKGQA